MFGNRGLALSRGQDRPGSRLAKNHGTLQDLRSVQAKLESYRHCRGPEKANALSPNRAPACGSSKNHLQSRKRCLLREPLVSSCRKYLNEAFW